MMATPTTSLPRRKLIHHIDDTPLSTPLHSDEQYLRPDVVLSLRVPRQFGGDARFSSAVVGSTRSMKSPIEGGRRAIPRFWLAA
jgi:hypothetical protein